MTIIKNRDPIQSDLDFLFDCLALAKDSTRETRRIKEPPARPVSLLKLQLQAKNLLC